MLRYLNLVRNVSNWPLHIADKLGLVKSDPLLFTGRNGVKIEVPRRLHHEFKEIFMENAYSIGLQKKPGRAPVIVDIGANVGFFTTFALSRYPDCRVCSYEPIPSNFQQLARNRDLNKPRDVRCYNQAVCGHTGTIKIFLEAPGSFTTSASIVHHDGDANSHFIEVPCLTLADVFAENNISRCDLLKLDCEGAEYDILYHTPPEILSKIDQMALEIHAGQNENEDLPSLKIFLAGFGFRLFQFDDKPHMLWAYRA